VAIRGPVNSLGYLRKDTWSINTEIPYQAGPLTPQKKIQLEQDRAGLCLTPQCSLYTTAQNIFPRGISTRDPTAVPRFLTQLTSQATLGSNKGAVSPWGFPRGTGVGEETSNAGQAVVPGEVQHSSILGACLGYLS
jgi:hypothetical protein